MGSRNYRKEGHKIKEKAVAAVFQNIITNEKIVETVRKLQAHLQRKVELRADDKLIYQALSKDLTANTQKVDHFITESYIQKHVLSKINMVEENLANGLSTDHILRNMNIEPKLVSVIEDTRYAGSSELATNIDTVINDIDQEIDNQIESGKAAIDKLAIKRKMLTIQENLSLPTHSKLDLENIFSKVELCTQNPSCSESKRIKFLTRKFLKANKKLIEKKVTSILENQPNISVLEIINDIKSKVSGLEENLIKQVVEEKVGERNILLRQKLQEKMKIEQDLQNSLQEVSKNLKKIVKLKAASIFFDSCRSDLEDLKEIIESYTGTQDTNVCLNYGSLTLPSCVTKANMVRFCNDPHVKEYLEVEGVTFTIENFSGLD